MTQHTIVLRTPGIGIIIEPSSLNVSAGDTVEFVSDDGKDYNIVIPNKVVFFGQAAGIIDVDANATNSPVLAGVNSNIPIGTTIYYSVTTPGGQPPYAPPRIIRIS